MCSGSGCSQSLRNEGCANVLEWPLIRADECIRVWLSAVPVCDPEVATETGTAASLMAPPARGQLGSSAMSDGGVSTSSGGPSCVVGRRVCLRLGIVTHPGGWVHGCVCFALVVNGYMVGAFKASVVGSGAVRAFAHLLMPVLLQLVVPQVVRCVDWKLRWLVMISMAMAVLCSVGLLLAEGACCKC